MTQVPDPQFRDTPAQSMPVHDETPHDKILIVDIGSQDDLNHSIQDPGGTTRPEKSDDIANDQAYDSDRRGNNR